VEYPTADWTWDDFKSTAAALTQDTDGDGTPDQYGTSFYGWPPPQIFVWQAGGDLTNEDLTESPIDSPEAIAGIQFYTDIAYNTEYAPSAETISEQGQADMFKAGKVAMFLGGAADDLDRVPGLDVGEI